MKVNEWNDYEIIARGGVMIHIMNRQLMAVFIDDNQDSGNNQPGLIGFEIESQPCEISVCDNWLRRFDSLDKRAVWCDTAKWTIEPRMGLHSCGVTGEGTVTGSGDPAASVLTLFGRTLRLSDL
jgi:hypothetical protein